MKTTRSSKLAKLLALALLAVCLNAGLARAENVAGKFTLPFDARWGTAVLPAGDYSFTIDTVGQHVATVRGENGAAIIMCSGVADHQFAGRSALIVVRTGRTGRIRALHLAEPGLVFSYAAPKGERPLFARAPELNQRVPVGISGK